MKKILFLIVIILFCLFAYSGTMDNYLNSQHRINPNKKYFGGIDQDEMTLTVLYVKATIAESANNTNYVQTAMNMSLPNKVYVTENKKFVPMNLRVVKSGMTADSALELILMSRCLVSTSNLVSTNQQYTTVYTNNATNYMGEYVIPEGNALYEFGYPIMYSNYFTEYSEILIRIENTSTLTCNIVVQLSGFEIDE